MTSQSLAPAPAGSRTSDSSLAVKPIPLAQAMADLAGILAHIEENDGEVPDDLLPVLNGGVAAVQAAVDRRIGLLKALASAREMISAERERLKVHDLHLGMVERRIKETTRAHMEAFGQPKLQGTAGRFQICKSGGNQSVQLHFNVGELEDVLLDETARLVPKEYVREAVVKVVDRKRLLEDVRAGIFLAPTETDPDGAIGSAYATLLPRGSYVRVY